MDKIRHNHVATELERLVSELDRLKQPRYLAGKARRVYDALQRLPEDDRLVLLTFHTTPGTNEARLAAYVAARGATVSMQTLYRHLERAEEALVAALPEVIPGDGESTHTGSRQA